MRPPVALCALAAACIGIYFLWFTAPGLEADFTPDDLMNMFQAWRWGVSNHLVDTVLFFRFSETFRPVGSLVYWLMLHSFGMENPLGFRVVCYVLMLTNLWLAYALVRRLCGSREVALLTVLLFAYHGEARSLYVNTGMCYDLLCLLFYSAAFVYYLRARVDGRALGARQLVVWSVLYVLCLNSKEMAVTLPVMIGVYELLANPPRGWRPAALANWVMWEGRVPFLGGILTALFLAGRMASARSLPSMDAYRPEFSLGVYLDRAHGYLRFVFYRSEVLTPEVFAGLAIVMTLVAIRWQSVPFRFGFLWMWIGILPVALIRLRGLDAVYVAAPGLALCIATALVELSRHLSPRGQKRAVALFACVLLLLVHIHRRYGSIDFSTTTAGSRHIRKVYEQLRRERPEIPEAGSVLFIQDPFPRNEWNSAFLLGLYTRDRNLHVNRLDRILREWKPDANVFQDVVFTYEDNRLQSCDPTPFQRVLVRELAGRRCQP